MARSGPTAAPSPRYAAMLGEDVYDEHVKDHLAELLKERADDARRCDARARENGERALCAGSALQSKKAQTSACTPYCFRRSARRTRRSCRCTRATSASYGDERALPVLLLRDRAEDIGFVAFQELKYAIEALGGEYEKERDFSADEAYKKIMAATAGADIFGRAKKK